jgi:hypothetical protein
LKRSSLSEKVLLDNKYPKPEIKEVKEREILPLRLEPEFGNDRLPGIPRRDLDDSEQA